MERKNEYPTFSSPTSSVSEEETRILTEHISQMNMFKLINLYEPHRKALTLKKFFKMKRHQEVVITPLNRTAKEAVITGKVTTIGRDFVMLTNLQKRVWLPYTAIESATIPFGTPTYTNPHQNHIYDNQLRKKIVLRFGETVSKRDALVQQFFEESMRTNLHAWKGTWVVVRTSNQTKIGKILKTDQTKLCLTIRNAEVDFLLEDILSVSTIRFMTMWKELLKTFIR